LTASSNSVLSILLTAILHGLLVLPVFQQVRNHIIHLTYRIIGGEVIVEAVGYFFVVGAKPHRSTKGSASAATIFRALAVERAFQRFARFEYRGIACWDAYRLLCFGVPARAGLAVLDLESAEADKLHFAAFGKFLRDSLECGFKRLLRGFFCLPRLFDDSANKL